jgi:hypothetical protein
MKSGRVPEKDDFEYVHKYMQRDHSIANRRVLAALQKGETSFWKKLYILKLMELRIMIEKFTPVFNNDGSFK